MKPRASSAVERFGWMAVAPFVIVFVTFTLWPLVQAAWLAVRQTYGPRSGVFVGLANFEAILTDPVFWKAFGNTATFAVLAVGIQIPLALGLALLLNRPGLRGRNVFRTVFFAPALVGGVFAAVLFALAFEKNTGLVNLGLAQVLPNWDLEFPWLQNYVMTSLVVASLWLGTGFSLVYFLAALQGVPRELEEAAAIDGAGPWLRFRHVILPHLAPVLSLTVLMGLLGALQLFELPWLIFNGPGPESRGLTLVMYLYTQGFLVSDLGYASAVGWVLASIMLSLAAIERSLARKREDAS